MHFLHSRGRASIPTEPQPVFQMISPSSLTFLKRLLDTPAPSGFETAAAYLSLTGIQAWATMGAKRFHQLTIPSSVETLILLADNDAEGRRARDRAWQAYQRPGLTIKTEWPPGGHNDWAQLLKR